MNFQLFWESKVYDIVNSRIDRIDPETKKLVDEASVKANGMASVTIYNSSKIEDKMFVFYFAFMLNSPKIKMPNGYTYKISHNNDLNESVYGTVRLYFDKDMNKIETPEFYFDNLDETYDDLHVDIYENEKLISKYVKMEDADITNGQKKYILSQAFDYTKNNILELAENISFLKYIWASAKFNRSIRIYAGPPPRYNDYEL